jgi:hypothetical protein
MKRGNSEYARVTDVSSRYGPEIARLLQRFAIDNLQHYARCKRAAVAWDWIHGEPVEEIERRYSPNPFQGRISYGDIVRFTDNGRFHLRSAQQIISVLVVDDQRLLDDLDILLRQLETGCPKDSIGLLDLPVTLTRGQLLALRSAGIKTVEGVWACSVGQLSELLGKDTARKLDAARPAIKTNRQSPGVPA